ncbi:hypothetical protein C8R43DRAFT_962857 [Mycena crocata]|nr:hypothetical protein C8R43DRAFT_962857 [Mycena crocata]
MTPTSQVSPMQNVLSSGPSSAPAVASKKKRISTKAAQVMKETNTDQFTFFTADFCNKVTDRPSDEQCDVLLAEIRQMPGEEHTKYTKKSMKQWFTAHRAKGRKDAATGSSVPPGRNAAYPSLNSEVTVGLNALWDHCETPHDRSRLYSVWVESPTFRDKGATEADIRAWLSAREHSELSQQTAPASISALASAPPPPMRGLRVDTTTSAMQVGPSTHSLSRSGILTPSDTTSPEPWFPAPPSEPEPPRPRSRSAARHENRFHPYQLPSPQSSRAASLNLKSESPLVYTMPIPVLESPVPDAEMTTELPTPVSPLDTPLPTIPHEEEEPPPFNPGFTILNGIKLAMMEGKLDTSPTGEIPTNMKEFVQLFQPWEDTIESLLDKLKNVPESQLSFEF